MLYGISPAELSAGLRTGRAEGSQSTAQPGVSSQLLPCTQSLCCLPVMTPTFITPGASSATSDTSHQPWLLSCSVEGSQRGSGSALCMQGPGLLAICRTMHEPGSADLAAPQPKATANISWHLYSVACTCLETPSAVSLESLRTSLALFLLDISTPGESQERHFTLCPTETWTFYSCCSI